MKGNWVCWAKLISMVAQIQGPRSWTVSYHTTFSAAGVPTNADECLEAVQSNLTGHSAHFLLGLWDM